MNSIEGLTQQVQELTELTQVQIRTIEQKEADLVLVRAALEDMQARMGGMIMEKARDKAMEHAPCEGMNCGTTTAQHSKECVAEHCAAVAGGVFVKGEPSVTVDGEKLLQLICAWENARRGHIALLAWDSVIAFIDAHTAAVTAKAVAEKQAETDQLRFDLSEATESLVARMAQASAPVAAISDHKRKALLELANRIEEAQGKPIPIACGAALAIRALLAAPQQHAQSDVWKYRIVNGEEVFIDPDEHSQAAQADDDLPQLTMSVYGTRTALELERQRRADVAARSAPAQPIAGNSQRPDYYYAGDLSPEICVVKLHDSIAYGHQCRAAALEEAAKVCMEQTNYMTFEREAFAAAIRALNKGGA